MNNSEISVVHTKDYQYKILVLIVFIDTHQNRIAHYQLFIQTILLASNYSSIPPHRYRVDILSIPLF